MDRDRDAHPDRRLFLKASLYGAAAAALSACGSTSPRLAQPDGGVPADQIDRAIAQLDRLVGELMAMTGLPGMAVAVVRGGKTVYAKGFGTKRVGTDDPVDADTVFQLASVSKSIGASVVAQQVALGRISWDTKLVEVLPWFKLSDEQVTAQVSLADVYSHRSGLPDHAGDRLEDLGFSQREVLERLRFVPLKPFRTTYAYTNFGMTAGGLAVETRAGVDWATLSEQTIYGPLGMTRTSSRYADFLARSNRVTGHVQVDGKWEPGQPRMPDAQAPAASVTSSVNDVARWLAMMLGQGSLEGRRVVDAAALAAVTSPQKEISPAHDGRPASYYGYGFNVGTTAGGRANFSHSGAFGLGAATHFRAVPSLDLGLVALTNGWPIAIPETLGQQFFELVELGALQRDWYSLLAAALKGITTPEGSLVGVAPPASPAAARPLAEYVGTYQNDYHGPLVIAESGGGLKLTLGPAPLTVPLSHWDGDVFTFTLDNENATRGTLSKATFGDGHVTLEFYDHEGLGTFVR